MLVLSFFSWWYGHGWQEIMCSVGSRLQGVAATFSAGQLLRTLFQPWRRIITYPGDSLAAKFHAWSDNAFSRAVGLVVRLMVLLAALLTMVVVLAVSILEVVVWPLLPPAVPVLLILGVL